MKKAVFILAVVLGATSCEGGDASSLTAEEELLVTALSGEEEDLQSYGLGGDGEHEDPLRPPLFRECNADGDFEALFARFDVDASQSLEGQEEDSVFDETSECSREHDRERQHRMELLRMLYDIDENGDLSEEERAVLFADFTERCAALHAWVLAEFDSDEDGVLSAEEEEALWDERDAMRADREECRPEGPPPPPPWVVEFDEDRDGRLSADELDTLRSVVRERLRAGEPPGEPPEGC